MNSIQNNGPDDKALNDDLEELGRVYRQANLEEPPELLDQAVLNIAHRAVEGKAGWMDFGWVHGLTTAAVVVLALSIILTQRPPLELDETGFEILHETRQDSLQVMPVARAPAVRGRVPAKPQTAARDIREDFRAKKVITGEDATATDEILLRSNAPEKVMHKEQPVASHADQTQPAEAASMQFERLEMDVDKSLSDRAETKRSQIIDADAQLSTILSLKQAGDTRWIAELESFIERYPDYPLPDELKN